MKKTTSFLLALCLTIGLTMPNAQAASSTATSAQQIIQALGIVTGDETGNLNLTGNVTRAEFAKMMIAASIYKDTISSTAKSSPFKDVKYTHWAASYVQAAVTSGWLTGYTDGTYKPDNNVKLEEAVSAVLKMLGYASSDFTGSFPEAQLAKYTALGLNVNISKTQGQVLTRQDCINLFYNLMSTKNKSGNYYATTLGYTVNSSGKLDYSSLVLANMEGPFIVENSSWSSDLPFTASAAAVYKNGSASSISAVSNYDVYYYNTGMKTVWVYRNRVSGVYTAASPSTSAPTSVTVAGKTYSIASSTAAYALSDMGLYGIGTTVTLLLGMEGSVVGVVSADNISTTKYGFVTATGTSTYTDSSGSSYTSATVTVTCTDGNSYEYAASSGLSKGSMVMVSFSGEKASVTMLSDTYLSGTINSTGTALSAYSFAGDIEILDSTSNGSCLRVYPSRLAGLSLNSSNIRYYVLDSSGNISHLILNDVTGDMYSYGILTSVSEYNSSTSLAINGSYKYTIKGVTGSYSSSSSAFGVSTGPARMEFSGSSLLSLKNLTGLSLSSLNTSYATSGSDSTQYPLGDGVSVYIYSGGSYNLSSVSVVNTGSYSLSGYYDKLPSAGGRIRVIVAYPN
ncbi:MAG: S-layer homology domain-containing protein [Oscillospiraceae bacterium]|nr:S-layer homology domain-containing protein [Oscillospiraceae bacterium]